MSLCISFSNNNFKLSAGNEYYKEYSDLTDKTIKGLYEELSNEIEKDIVPKYLYDTKNIRNGWTTNKHNSNIMSGDNASVSTSTVFYPAFKSEYIKMNSPVDINNSKSFTDIRNDYKEKILKARIHDKLSNSDLSAFKSVLSTGKDEASLQSVQLLNTDLSSISYDGQTIINVNNREIQNLHDCIISNIVKVDTNHQAKISGYTIPLIDNDPDLETCIDYRYDLVSSDSSLSNFTGKTYSLKKYKTNDGELRSNIDDVYWWPNYLSAALSTIESNPTHWYTNNVLSSWSYIEDVSKVPGNPGIFIGAISSVWNFISRTDHPPMSLIYFNLSAFHIPLSVLGEVANIYPDKLSMYIDLSMPTDLSVNIGFNNSIRSIDDVNRELFKSKIYDKKHPEETPGQHYNVDYNNLSVCISGQDPYYGAGQNGGYVYRYLIGLKTNLNNIISNDGIDFTYKVNYDNATTDNDHKHYEIHLSIAKIIYTNVFYMSDIKTSNAVTYYPYYAEPACIPMFTDIHIKEWEQNKIISPSNNTEIDFPKNLKVYYAGNKNDYTNRQSIKDDYLDTGQWFKYDVNLCYNIDSKLFKKAYSITTDDIQHDIRRVWIRVGLLGHFAEGHGYGKATIKIENGINPKIYDNSGNDKTEITVEESSCAVCVADMSQESYIKGYNNSIPVYMGQEIAQKDADKDIKGSIFTIKNKTFVTSDKSSSSYAELFVDFPPNTKSFKIWINTIRRDQQGNPAYCPNYDSSAAISFTMDLACLWFDDPDYVKHTITISTDKINENIPAYATTNNIASYDIDVFNGSIISIRDIISMLPENIKNIRIIDIDARIYEFYLQTIDDKESGKIYTINDNITITNNITLYPIYKYETNVIWPSIPDSQNNDVVPDWTISKHTIIIDTSKAAEKDNSMPNNIIYDTMRSFISLTDILTNDKKESLKLFDKQPVTMMHRKDTNQNIQLTNNISFNNDLKSVTLYPVYGECLYELIREISDLSTYMGTFQTELAGPSIDLNDSGEIKQINSDFNNISCVLELYVYHQVAGFSTVKINSKEALKIGWRDGGNMNDLTDYNPSNNFTDYKIYDLGYNNNKIGGYITRYIREKVKENNAYKQFNVKGNNLDAHSESGNINRETKFKLSILSVILPEFKGYN